MSRCALPLHLKSRKHNDWPWPLSYLPRSINAKGPRCPQGSNGYMPWPPRLIEGKGVARWEKANDGEADHSIIEIPALARLTVKGSDVYGREWEAVERNQGHPDFGKNKVVTLPPWREATVKSAVVDIGDFISFPVEAITVTPNDYSPSALQYFSRSGWMKLFPEYHCQWDWRIHFAAGKPKGPFWRWGWRPDHEDEYYNWGPFAGLQGE